MLNGAKTIVSLLAGALVGASGLFFALGKDLGRGEVRAELAAVQTEVQGQKERVNELRGDVQAAAAAARTAADETRQAREVLEKLVPQLRVRNARGGRP